jgi:hypothetical protein
MTTPHGKVGRSGCSTALCCVPRFSLAFLPTYESEVAKGYHPGVRAIPDLHAVSTLVYWTELRIPAVPSPDIRRAIKPLARLKLRADLSSGPRPRSQSARRNFPTPIPIDNYRPLAQGCLATRLTVCGPSTPETRLHARSWSEVNREGREGVGGRLHRWRRKEPALQEDGQVIQEACGGEDVHSCDDPERAPAHAGAR